MRLGPRSGNRAGNPRIRSLFGAIRRSTIFYRRLVFTSYATTKRKSRSGSPRELHGMENIRGGLLTKSASAYEYLRRLSAEGRLRPGRRLSPPDLANELQVSQTPIRDALARLAAEGFISGRDGRGYFTKAYTVEEQR